MDSRDDLIDGFRIIAGDQPGNPLAPVWRNPTQAEFIAAVRAGVESGSIKGEERWLCREEGWVHDWAEGPPTYCWFRGGGKHNPECGPHIVTGPVSGGGEG